MISIVICTHNRSRSLSRTLSSLSQLWALQALCQEVIVVDNNSTDNTRTVVDAFVSAFGLTVKYVFEAAPGLARARNRGVMEAAGDIVAFIDDDVIVSPEWLSELSRAFNTYGAACVGGKVLLSADLRKPEWWHKSYDAPLGAFDLGDLPILADQKSPELVGIGANISFKRSVFDRLGLFRTDLGRNGRKLLMGEDHELARRLRQHGERAVYYPAALVYHCPGSERMSKHYLRRWHFRIGEWMFFQPVGSSHKGKQILSVPGWRYRSAIEDLFSMIWSGLRGELSEMLLHELQLMFFIGYFTGSIKRYFHSRDAERW